MDYKTYCTVLLWRILSSIISLFNRDLRRQKYKPSTMGPEIIVISGSKNNRGQISADLVISEPRNNSSSNLSELGLFDFWILPRTKHHMSPLLVLYLVYYLSAVVHVTHHLQQRITNTPMTAYCACCVRDRASSSHKRDSSSTTTIKTTTGTPHQHHSSSAAEETAAEAVVA